MTDLGADIEIVDEDTTNPNAYVAHSVEESSSKSMCSYHQTPNRQTSYDGQVH
jgi:hypothetical protein